MVATTASQWPGLFSVLESFVHIRYASLKHIHVRMSDDQDGARELSFLTLGHGFLFRHVFFVVNCVHISLQNIDKIYGGEKSA